MPYRRVTVVRRKRPQKQPQEQPREFESFRAGDLNDRRVLLPQQRRGGSEVINRNLLNEVCMW